MRRRACPSRIGRSTASSPATCSTCSARRTSVACSKEAHRVLDPEGLLCLASLTRGRTVPARIVTRLWETIWSHRPQLVGGCRPISIGRYARRDLWAIHRQRTVTTAAVTSEILIAGKQPSARREEDGAPSAVPGRGHE